MSRRMRLSLFERSGEGYQKADFDARLHQLVEADGGGFVAPLPRFHNGPDSQRFYLPLDGHPTPAGYDARAAGGVTGIKDADGGVLTARVSCKRGQWPRDVGARTLLIMRWEWNDGTSAIVKSLLGVALT
jgi:hypothetical protein